MVAIANPFSSIKLLNQNTNFRDADVPKALYRKRYPRGLDLNPDSELHQQLLSYLMVRAKASNDEMQKRHHKWRELDRKLTGYIDLSEAKFDDTYTDQDIQDAEPHKPVSIVLPQSYATKDVFLTHMVSTYFNHPVFRYESFVDPSDTIGNIILEAVVDYQVRKERLTLPIYTCLGDDITYGFGGVAHSWITRRGFRTRKGAATQEVVRYNGNTMDALDPYNTLPDINYPVQDTHKHRYFGWVERKDFFGMLEMERDSENIFNVEYLRKAQTGKSVFFNDTESVTGRYDQTMLARDNLIGLAAPFDVMWMYAKVIPSEFGLGAETYPEWWMFGVGADRVIIAASPISLDLNRVPVSVSATGSDGHSILSPSLLEIDFPMQHAMDWLWASRVTNIRKAINNMWVADPSLINMDDLVDTRAGMIARLRPSAWGRGLLRDALEQIPVADVTANHIGDINFLKQMRDEFSGRGPQSRGVQERKGSRVSAQEARSTRIAGLSRNEKTAWLFGVQFMQNAGEWLASNTLQFMNEEQYVRITGDYERVLMAEYGETPGLDLQRNAQGTFAKVNFAELDVNYDVAVSDGSLPSGEFADVWERLVNNSASHPELFQSLDFTRIWLHTARLLGAKNPQAFLKKADIQPEVRPDAEVEAGAQAGNLVPVEELANQNGGL